MEKDVVLSTRTDVVEVGGVSKTIVTKEILCKYCGKENKQAYERTHPIMQENQCGKCFTLLFQMGRKNAFIDDNYVCYRAVAKDIVGKNITPMTIRTKTRNAIPMIVNLWTQFVIPDYLRKKCTPNIEIPEKPK